MPYMTAKQSPRYHQVTMEDILFGDADPFAKPAKPWRERIDQGATRTWYAEVVPDTWYQKFNVAAAIDRLEKFAVQFAPLYEADRWSLYDHWTVPKRNGGRRPIDAPKPELEVALRTLKAILETDFGALHHTSAFAYVKGRCTLDAARKHQQNESRWFLHTDFSNFFGRTTLPFVVEMLARIWPFSEVCRYPRGKEALEKALDLCLRGNHEQFAIDYAGSLTPRWERNGGAATLRSYDLNGADMEDDIAWFRSLPLVYDAGEILVCHAGLSCPRLCDNTEDDLLWGREWIAYDRRPREKQVVFGHTPLRTFLPYTTGTGDICIDCGCVYGGSLCSLAIQKDGNRAFVSVRKSEKDSETELENREKE